jgi:hypothetical protein
LQTQLTALLGMILCLLSMSGFASMPSEEDLNQYIEISNIHSVLEGVEDQMEGQLNQMMVTKDAELIEKIKPVMIASWDIVEGNSIVRNVIKQRITSDEIKALIQFHSQPWVQSIAHAEKQVDGPNFESEMVRFFEDMQKQPPSASRAESIRSFVEKTQMVDLVMNMIVKMTQATHMAFNDAADDTDAEWLQTEKEIMKMTPQMEQQLTMMSYFLYRDISEDDLKTYGDFYAEDLGRKESGVILGGVEKVFVKWTEKLATDIKNME